MIKILNSIIWSIAIILLLESGFIFSRKLNFLQLRINKIIKPLASIDNLKSLFISLGAKIGVGSLSGMAIAIYYGGIGSIFWMYLCFIITSIISYVETYLGVMYKHKNESGAFYYIKEYSYNLSIIYAILLIIVFIFGFLTIQVNTIINTININNKYLITFFLLLIISFIIFKGRKEIKIINTIIVPLMMFIYIIIGIYIIINNINLIPNIIINIIKEAFNKKAFLSGIIIGVERAIFATEIGTGTSCLATSDVNDSKENQALTQLFGTLFISFIICTITIFIILLSNYQVFNTNNINGIELIINAFNYHLGNKSIYLLSLIIILFAFSTIISCYYYGEITLKYLISINNKRLILFKIFTIFLLFLGSILSSNYLWSLIDIFLGIITIINIYVLIKLKDKIKKI